MLSIIVPVYNVENYIKRCIDSILCQNEYQYELILVDDGSTDRSGEICDSYAGDSRVHVIHKENDGTSSAKNIGIETAKGEYLWFVDSDDWVGKDAISTIGRSIDHQDMILFGAYRAIECEDGTFEMKPFFTPVIRDTDSMASEKEIRNANVTLWNKVFRKEWIGTQRFAEELRFGEDAVFYHQIIRRDMKATQLPQMLYYYHINRSGNTVSSPIDERTFDLLQSSIDSYTSLRNKGWAVAGIRRINIVLDQVISKVQSTEEIREKKDYITRCKYTARYPSLTDQIQYLRSDEVGRYQKIVYISWILNPWHVHMTVKKRK